MPNALLKFVDSLISEAAEVTDQVSYDRWALRMQGGLGKLDQALKAELMDLGPRYWSWPDRLAQQEGILQAVLFDQAVAEDAHPTVVSPPAPTRGSGVFVVHGHDEAAKESVARFVSNLGLEPIILHEQASASKTLIEKLERYGNVAFAIVLLTPDDIGGINKEDSPPLPRARQNVILELGYFIGRLGRERVCALHKGGVELPSDYAGVLYIELDTKGAWRTKVAQELVHAGLQIQLDALLKA
jgi:predicted nucleotide-binding protein